MLNDPTGIRQSTSLSADDDCPMCSGRGITVDVSQYAGRPFYDEHICDCVLKKMKPLEEINAG